ncbi:aldehyde dehydrogenase family protein [Actinocorallia sp. A-T 12471]|uniref:aldehyde dehydrogenase family protein n=1 Tax=Actinocorallia sp. A-T 12471 TaxID=3089813 RepID=UPI0029D2F25E|nr:aldehyde dehydrogenase family protein [Actinocorallia sp. A-T 12471]MDX6739627.1 aldehyde dehydrogenase family protein [Actinocorallia sp. A-T 12471]
MSAELPEAPESVMPDAVPGIVAAARAAFPGWRDAAPHARADVLRRAADLVRERLEDLAILHARESGKVIAQARGEVRGAARLLEVNAELGRTWAGTLAPTGALPGGERDLTLVERVPVGVVVAVIPFNFPVELTVEKAAAALATGNVVIVKPPPQNPRATAAVCAILREAGVPEGVLQVVPGGTEVSAALCAAPGVAAVSLTGSVSAGVAVARATAHLLRPLHLELGGNGAAIVLPDADLDLVVAETLRGRLLMNGQACAATKRIIAHRSVAGELTGRLEAALAEVVPTDPLKEDARLGHLIDAAAAGRVAAQVGGIVADGGRLVLGRAEADGPWFAPALLADVPADAAVAVDDEIFGPVFPVIPVDSDEQAAAVADASALRLTAGVFSRDLPRAIALAQRLDFGGVVVNGTGNYRPPVVPFGGVELAGAGREGDGYTIEEMTRTRFLALRGLRPAAVPLPEGS